MGARRRIRAKNGQEELPNGIAARLVEILKSIGWKWKSPKTLEAPPRWDGDEGKVRAYVLPIEREKKDWMKCWKGKCMWTQFCHDLREGLRK